MGPSRRIPRIYGRLTLNSPTSRGLVFTPQAVLSHRIVSIIKCANIFKTCCNRIVGKPPDNQAKYHNSEKRITLDEILPIPRSVATNPGGSEVSSVALEKRSISPDGHSTGFSRGVLDRIAEHPLQYYKRKVWRGCKSI